MAGGGQQFLDFCNVVTAHSRGLEQQVKVAAREGGLGTPVRQVTRIPGQNRNLAVIATRRSRLEDIDDRLASK